MGHKGHMAIQNPDYNPEWEALYDYHRAQYERLRDELNAKCRKEGLRITDPEFDRLSKEQDFHHNTCLHCLDTLQHKTVQDFAHWLFHNFELTIDKSFIPPFEGFKTLEEARQAWQYLRDLEAKREEEEQSRREEAEMKS